jgi:hypothetical protein
MKFSLTWRKFPFVAFELGFAALCVRYAIEHDYPGALIVAFIAVVGALVILAHEPDPPMRPPYGGAA